MVTNDLNDLIRRKAVDLAIARGPTKSLCPSEIIRNLFKSQPDSFPRKTIWRDYIDATRDIVYDLEAEGVVQVLQKGVVIENPRANVKGPIRLRIASQGYKA